MPQPQDAIHFIMTGGTIDSYYEATKDTAVTLKHSALPSFMKSLKLYREVVFTEVCMKDSRGITVKDLHKMLHIIQRSPHKRVVITHGSYTMPDTARFLQANLKKLNKTIVLTGSMIPLTGFSPSDAPFNLGFALSEVSVLLPGVYVCMNGRVFTAAEVAKEISKGRFVSVFMPKGW